MKIAVGLVAFTLLTLSATSRAADDSKLRKALVQHGKNAAMEKLKDPDSAKFKGLFAGKYDSFLCGEINAKNSHGGYVGFKRFFAAETAGNYVVFEGDRNFDDEWEDKCRSFDPKLSK